MAHSDRIMLTLTVTSSQLYHLKHLRSQNYSACSERVISFRGFLCSPDTTKDPALGLFEELWLIFLRTL